MKTKTWIGLSAMALALLLGACASDAGPPAPGFDEPDSGPPGGPGGPGDGRAGPEGGPGRGGGGQFGLFISPAGKPYRAKPGEPYPSAVWFAEADTDHDGRLSLAEFRADAEAFFRLLDTDHDGEIDGFEVAAYERSLPEILPRVQGLRAGEGMDANLGLPGHNRGPRDENVGDGGGGRRGGGGAAQREGAGLFGFLDQPEPVSIADTDLDSHITLKEALAAADRRFEILDTNKDGYLTLAELPKTPVQAYAEKQAEQRRKREAQGRGGTGGPPR